MNYPLIIPGTSVESNRIARRGGSSSTPISSPAGTHSQSLCLMMNARRGSGLAISIEWRSTLSLRVNRSGPGRFGTRDL